MANEESRVYNCKDEELSVICRHAASGFRRDLADFSAYSPKFNLTYANGFDAQITSVTAVVEPESETIERKRLTARIYTRLAGLQEPVNRISGYLSFLSAEQSISDADFGITGLRDGINTKDTESVLGNLQIVNKNIAKYRDVLREQGLTDEIAANMLSAADSISADNEAQYEITVNRHRIVKENISLFNATYKQLREILRVGKILYKISDPVKARQYTLRQLLKTVRLESKTASDSPAAPAAPGTTPGSTV